MTRQINIWDELIVDNFAGGGGASTGIELATGRPVDIAINHDPAAIAMHNANHPYTKHYCESVWDIKPKQITGGRSVALAWFSPDCKHFSKAKGGKPVDKSIRGLAWVAVRWAATVHPRVIILENVEEFTTWGPVVDGKPNKSRTGETFKNFIFNLEKHGYTVEWRILKACDYGAPTIRKRFFLVARCDGLSIVWPELTHGAPNSEAVRSGRLKPWRTAAEIIDWTLPCPSIFDTTEEIYKKYGQRAVRPLADATLRRIARGIKKFVIDNPNPFVISVNHSGDNFRRQNINEPLDTVTAKLGYGIVTPYIASIGQMGFSNDRSRSMTAPLNTTVTKAEQCLITPTLIQYHGEQSENEVRGQSIESPLLTVDGTSRYAMAAATLIQTGYGEAPGQLPRVPGIDKPLGTVVSDCKHAVIASSLIKLKGKNIGQYAMEPLQTITAGGNHFGEVRAFLVKFYGQGTGQETTKPLHTITGRDTFGLVTVHGEQYVIVDIGLRMLTPRELFNAQGFPPDYIIDHDADGKPYPKAAQVARCGNSVPPPFAEALVRANLPELCGKKLSSIAELGKEIAM